MNYRKQPLRIPNDATRADLEATLRRLEESGAVSAEAINNALDGIRMETAQLAREVSKVESGIVKTENVLSPEVANTWLSQLKERFDKYPQLHTIKSAAGFAQSVEWADVERSLRASPKAMWSLFQLDEKGHEVNILGEDHHDFIFGTASLEAPAGHRNIVYDREAQDLVIKKDPSIKCAGNAVDIAKALGVDLMDKDQYHYLRSKLKIKINQKTWNWLKTDVTTRKSGDSFCGNGYGVFKRNADDHVHFGGFRGALRVTKA